MLHVTVLIIIKIGKKIIGLNIWPHLKLFSPLGYVGLAMALSAT